MVAKECKNCECKKIFFTNSAKKDYCSKRCRTVAAKKRRDASGQLCWLCEKATGGCSWSGCFKPIPGWVASMVEVKDKEGSYNTYKIVSCPEFIKG